MPSQPSFAYYRKADLQVHSPRDANWDGARPHPAGGASLDAVRAARDSWADSFIDACIGRGLQLVALTDHHEGIVCWHAIDRLKARRVADPNLDLVILPGMELTCKDSAQALILFDHDLSRALFEKARGKLNLPVECNEFAAKGIDVQVMRLNIEEVQPFLDADEELRGRFIILPNVTPRGHKTVLREGFHRRFRELPYVGGYLDGTYPHELDAGERRILDGEIPAWSSTKRGIVATSDARHDDFRKLGTYATWIKMAEPTAEALRQALLAADSRLLYETPRAPTLYIHSVAVAGGAFLQLSGPLQFSPQYNAIIGGRGAGKSTLLEYVRFALCRSALDTEASAWDPTHERRKDLLRNTLDQVSGKVTLVVWLNGALVEVTRTRAAQERVSYMVGDAERTVSPADLRELLKVQAFSQGELSHLGDASAANRLLELITDPARTAFDDIETNLRQHANRLREELSQLVSTWEAERERRKTDAEVATVEAQVVALRAQLATGQAEDQQIIADHATVVSTSEWIADAKRVHDEGRVLLKAALNQYTRSVEVVLTADRVPAAEAAQSAALALRDLTGKLREIELLLASQEDQTAARVTEAMHNWEAARAGHDARYREAVERLSGARSAADTLTSLEARLAELRGVRTAHAAVAERETEAFGALQETAATFVSSQAERFRLAGELAQSVEEQSAGMARAEIERAGNLDALEDALAALFAGTRVREERLAAIMGRIATAESPALQWWNLLREMLAILRWKTTGLRDTQDRPTSPILDAEVDSGGIDRFCERLSVERLTSAIAAEVKPRVKFFQRKHGTDVDFGRASQGEKVTILLSLLMQQDGGPLLLDQPEEDLDNRIIGQVITTARLAKQSRQLIVATHNANLVVNGDAELVAEFSAGAISAQGAIDHAVVREAIAATMEGGKEAFELRRKKYNF